MTQGGKRIRNAAPGPSSSPFAPLSPLARGASPSAEDTLSALAKALASYNGRGRIHLRLIDGDRFDHWDVEVGTKASAHRRQPTSADVHVVLRHETWQQIAQGRLSPFDALFAGTLRVGGDVALAKRLVQHLSDPSVPFVSPC
jgi:SCP-2 sterol transfer family